jgi:hypothetical protein
MLASWRLLGLWLWLWLWLCLDSAWTLLLQAAGNDGAARNLTGQLSAIRYPLSVRELQVFSTRYRLIESETWKPASPTSDDQGMASCPHLPGQAKYMLRNS